MIKIQLLGGAKKSFPNGAPVINDKSIRLAELLERIRNDVPDGAPALELDTMLVALNGADSSALQDALVHDGDTVSIIPIVHGGQAQRPTFDIMELKPMTKDALDSLRDEFATLHIQLIRRRYILGMSHAKKIVRVSLAASKRNALLSDKLETDILMRFAGTTQISRAIQDAGIKDKENAVLVAVGPSARRTALQAKLAKMTVRLVPGKTTFLARRFSISKVHMDAVNSASPLEDILVERAVVLG